MLWYMYEPELQPIADPDASKFSPGQDKYRRPLTLLLDSLQSPLMLGALKSGVMK